MWTLVKTVMNIRAPKKAGNFFNSKVTISFSRMTVLHGVKMLHRTSGERLEKTAE